MQCLLVQDKIENQYSYVSNILLGLKEAVINDWSTIYLLG